MITINDHVCTESEVAVIAEALSLLTDIGYGKISTIGDNLKRNFLSRTGVTNGFRKALTRVQQLFNESQNLLHDSQDFKAGFSPQNDVVPVSSVIAHNLASRIEGDKKGMENTALWIKTQSDMTKSSFESK